MPIELTDEDKAKLATEVWFHPNFEHIYRAGLAAGIERAAKVCEYVDRMVEFGLDLKRGDHATAVRALLK